MNMTTQPSRRNAIRLALLSTMSALVFLIGSGRAIAHPGHEHKLMGVIAAINGDQVTIKTNDGKEHTVEIVATTTFLRGKQKGTKDDLKVGLRLVITAADASGKDPLKAKRIQYAAAS